jgi:lipopolysaccharide transport system ATP-binding protein
MSVVIKVEDLSKQYRLGQVGRRTLSHDFNRWWHTVRGKEDPYLKIGQENDRSVKGTSQYVWSLKDINFEVNEGDVVGIIGRNGAGKSTLLKILSKVTAPTKGEVKLRGRIASLLEVGTGFHPELSGRDNIFLNGAILGMTKNETKRKFDEIVSFAGVERYIDTPVKRYSSGMYVRLAFAVAAHLEPDILIVDEVLAVGDAEFQRKCLGKMKDVSVKEGRTVLFVSHNLSSIENLCTKGILLDKGKLYVESTASKAVSEYIRLNSREDGHQYTGDGIIKEAALLFTKVDATYKSDLEITVNFESALPIKNVVLGIVIKDLLDTPLIGVNNKHYVREPLNKVELQKGKLYAKFKDLALLPGEYKVDIFLGDSVLDVESIENALSFSIEDTSVHNTATPLDYRLNKMFIEEVNWGILPN